MHGCTYAIIPDQIEAGTLMIAAAATHGDVLIRGALPTHMEALTAKLLEMGARVDEGVGEDSIRVRSDGNHRHVNIKTLPYPGFPTDLQQPMSVLLSTARGTSIINETIYEMRYKHLGGDPPHGRHLPDQRPHRHHRGRSAPDRVRGDGLGPSRGRGAGHRGSHGRGRDRHL